MDFLINVYLSIRLRFKTVQTNARKTAGRISIGESLTIRILLHKKNKFLMKNLQQLKHKRTEHVAVSSAFVIVFEKVGQVEESVRNAVYEIEPRRSIGTDSRIVNPPLPNSRKSRNTTLQGYRVTTMFTCQPNSMLHTWN